MSAVVVSIPEGVARWLASGEHGASSQFIVAHLVGLDVRGERAAWGPAHPLDPDDLRRCRILTEVFAPELRARIREMKIASRYWAALVEAWDQICSTMDEEIPDWGRPRCRGSAPRTYALMRATLDGVR